MAAIGIAWADGAWEESSWLAGSWASSFSGLGGELHPVSINFDNIHVGAIGVIFQVTLTENEIAVDISDATIKTITIVSPDGTKLEVNGVFETDGTDGILNYVTLENTLLIPGEHKLQAYIRTPDWAEKSSIHKFEVIQNL